MSFLTLFVVSCLFYIVETNETKHSSKIKECGCKDILDSFNKDAIFKLYANGYNPLDYKNELNIFIENVLHAIEATGIDSKIMEQKLDFLLNEMSAKTSSDTGMSVSELKGMLDNFVVKIIQFINSPDFKNVDFKAKLDTFIADLQNILVDNGLKPANFSEELDKFEDDVLKLANNTGFDPWLLKQKLDELLKQLTIAISSDKFTPVSLKVKFTEFINYMTDTMNDPEVTQLNYQYHMTNFDSDLSLAITKNVLPLIGQSKSDEKENFKEATKDACMKYANYMLFEMQQKSYNGSKPVIEPQEDDDMIVSFLTPDDDPE